MGSFSSDDIDAELQRRGIDLSKESSSQAVASVPSANQYVMQDALSSLGHGAYNLASAPFIGLAKGFQGLVNTPYNIANSINLSVAQNIPHSTTDISAFYGNPHPGIASSLLQGAGQFAPYAMAGGPSVLGQMGAGGAFGLTQSPTPLTSAPIQAAASLLPSAAGYLSNYLANALAPSVVSKSLAPDILQSLGKVYSKKAGDLTSQVGNLTEDDAHSAAMNMAQNLGKDGAINGNGFKNNIQDIIDNLRQRKIDAPFQADSINPAIKKMQGVLNSPLNNYADAFKLAKNLNDEYGNKNMIDKKLPFAMINEARGELENTINNSAQSASPQALQALQTRNLANALTQQRVRQQLFSGTHSDTNLGVSQFLDKYNGLSGQEKANLFAPEDINNIELMNKAYKSQKFAGLPGVVNKVVSPAAGILSKIPGASQAAQWQLAHPQYTGQVPSLVNSAFIPQVNNVGQQ